jgi:hypothetical protein
LLEQVGDWFRGQKIEPLGTTRLNRLLRSEMHPFATAILKLIVVHLASNALGLNDVLLASEEKTVLGTRTAANEQDVGFDQLRLDIAFASLDTDNIKLLTDRSIC